MKISNANLKRFLALALVLAMLSPLVPTNLSSLFTVPGNAVGATLTDPGLQYFTGDDFSDAQASAELWNGVTAADITNQFPTNSSGTSMQTEFEQMLASGIETYNTANPDATFSTDVKTYYDDRSSGSDTFLAYKSESVTPKVWSEGTFPVSFEMDFRLAPNNYTDWKSGNFYIRLADSGDEFYAMKSGAGVDGHGAQRSLEVHLFDKNGRVNKFYVPAWSNGAAVMQENTAPYSWAHLSASYDYSKWEESQTVSVTVTMKVYKAQYSNGESSINLATQEILMPSRTYDLTFTGEVNTLTVGFTNFWADAAVNIDNVVVLTSAEQAQTFYNTYSTFLSKDLDSLSKDDFDTFSAMYNAWAALSAPAKAQLLSSGITADLIESFEAKFVDLCGQLSFDDFESAFKTEQWWGNLSHTSLEADGDNHYLKVTANSMSNALMPAGWSASEKPTEVSFKFKLDSVITSNLMFVWDKDNSTQGGLKTFDEGGFGLRNQKSEALSMTSGDNGGKLILNPNSQWASAGSHNEVDVDYTKWITLKATYDWTSWESSRAVTITFEMNVYNKATSQFEDLKGKDITYTFPENHSQTILPGIYVDSGCIYIDDFTVVTTKAEASAFAQTHAELLAKDTVTLNDLPAYLAAYNDYAALDASALVFLEAETAKMNGFKSTFESIYADQTFYKDDFDTAFITEQFFTATGDTAVTHTEVDSSVSDGLTSNAVVHVPSGATFAIKDGKLPTDERPLSATVVLRYPSGSVNVSFLSEGENYPYVNFGTSLITGNGVQGTGITASPNDNWKKLLAFEGSGMSPIYVGEDLRKAAYWDRSKMLTIKANFDYSQWDQNIIKVSYDIKFWGYNFNFDTDNKPIDINNESNTYQYGWIEYKDIGSFTYTFTDVNDVKFIPRIVSSGAVDVTYVEYSTATRKVEDFLTDHAGIIATTATNVRTDDLTAINALLDAYGRLGVGEQANEDIHHAYLHACFLKKVVQNAYEYDSDDIDSVLNMWRKVKYANTYEKTYQGAFLDALETDLLAHINAYIEANPANTQKPTITVAFAGHSMVAGMNAGEKGSYPTQLVELLAENNPSGLNFTFWNRACSGSTTSNWNDPTSKYAIEIEQLLPDVIVITIGGNDNSSGYEENLNKLIDYYQSMESCPTIVLTTEMHWYGRNVDKIIEIQRKVAEERGVLLMDFKAYTEAAYNADVAEYKAEGMSEEDAVAAAKKLWWWSGSDEDTDYDGDGLHYNGYGYSRVAEYAKTFFDRMYNEFSLPYGSFQNVVFYEAEDEVEANADYSQLTYAQRKYYRQFHSEEYNALGVDAGEVSSAVSNYKTAYSTFLATDPASITADSLTEYAAAADAYYALSAAAKDGLTAEKAQLDAIYEALTAKLTEVYTADGIGESVPVTQHNYQAIVRAYAAHNAMSIQEKADHATQYAQLRAAIQRYDGQTEDRTIRVLLVGDSITAGTLSDTFLNPTPYSVFLQNDLGRGYMVQNDGVHGAATSDYLTTEKAERGEYFMPNIVLFMLGTNDVNKNYYFGESVDAEDLEVGGKLYNQYLNIINHYRSMESAPTVIIATIPYGPNHLTYGEGHNITKIEQINAMIRRLAEIEGLPLVDMYALTKTFPEYENGKGDENYIGSDGLHFAAAGHEAMSDLFYNTLITATADIEKGYIHTMDLDKTYFEQVFAGMDTTADPLTASRYPLVKSAYKAIVNPATKSALESFYNGIIAKESDNQAFMPQVLGGTIRTTNNVRTQNLRMQFQLPTAAVVPDGYKAVAYGVLFLPTHILGTAELTLDTPSVASSEIALSAGEELPENFFAVLNGSAGNEERCGWNISSRAYVVYENEAGERFYVYSGNSGTNIENGTGVRSVYGIARLIAASIKDKEGLNWDAIANKDLDNATDEAILTFITANRSYVTG